MFESMPLADLRRRLVDANAESERCFTAVQIERARAVQRALDANPTVQASLKNERDRSRFDWIAMSDDAEYNLAFNRHEEAKSVVARIEAEIMIREDATRAQELDLANRELALIGSLLNAA